MLQISTLTMESQVGVDYAQVYADSDLYRCCSNSDQHPCLISVL